MDDVVKGDEFWLPPEFFTDDEIFFGKGNTSRSDALCFPSEFPYEFGTSSNELESDDEELVGLTRHFSRSTLSFRPPYLENKWRGFSGSPQSTLNQAGNWSSVFSNGSPNGPSQFPSAPTTPFIKVDDTWDLISMATAQVARLKMNIEGPTNTRALLAVVAASIVSQPNYSGYYLSYSHSHRCHISNQPFPFLLSRLKKFFKLKFNFGDLFFSSIKLGRNRRWGSREVRFGGPKSYLKFEFVL